MAFLEDSYRGHKMLVIGPYKAGKSCYIRRLVDGYYDVKERYKQTMGGMFSIYNMGVLGCIVILRVVVLTCIAVGICLCI